MWLCIYLKVYAGKKGLQGGDKFSNKVAQKYEDKHQWENGKKRNFPGGTVDKNPPANVENTSSSPGQDRFHMPQSNWAQLLSIQCPACALQREKSTNKQPRHHSQEQPLPKAATARESPHAAAEIQQTKQKWANTPQEWKAFGYYFLKFFFFHFPFLLSLQSGGLISFASLLP